MKKILLLIIFILLLTGCGAEPISGDNNNEASYYIQDSAGFSFYVDKKTCIEYIIYQNGYQGGITSRLNTDGTLKLNETCLKNKEWLNELDRIMG